MATVHDINEIIFKTFGKSFDFKSISQFISRYLIVINRADLKVILSPCHTMSAR